MKSKIYQKDLNEKDRIKLLEELAESLEGEQNEEDGVLLEEIRRQLRIFDEIW